MTMHVPPSDPSSAEADQAAPGSADTDAARLLAPVPPEDARPASDATAGEDAAPSPSLQAPARGLVGAPGFSAPDASRRPWPRIVVALALLAFGLWGAWTRFAPGPVDPARQLRDQRTQIDSLKQQTATLSRSDQISRDANRDLQGTLAERDEEISGLRADVAFYERFVGATGQRRGLTVHELQLQPQDGNEQAWHFTATLTQNLNRGAVSSGRLMLSIEGTRDGRLQKLAWTDLRQQASAPGVDYSFKYFQQVEGDVILPPAFKPIRVSVRLSPQGGAAVDQSFAWADATAGQDG